MGENKVPSEASVSESLVERILSGDTNAEEEMVKRYQKGLGVMLFNRSSDRSLAEDIAQETWVLVLNKLRGNELRDRRRLAAFIIQIAKNQLIMRQRSSKNHESVNEEEGSYLSDPKPSPEQALGRAQLGQSVSAMLDELKVDRDREILRRFYLVGDEKDQLCEEFDLTPAHFDRVLYRARERFKSLWEESIGNKYL